MGLRWNSTNALAYMGVRATQPPQLVISKKDPGIKDGLKYELGTFWLVPLSASGPSKNIWVLTGKSKDVATWIKINGAGGAIPGIQYTVLTSDGAGDYGTSISPSSSGRILTSNGINSLPSFQDNSAITTINIQTFATSGVYIPTSNMIYCIVELVGGGGAGGTLVAAGAMGTGSGAAYCRREFSAAQIGISQAVTIGAGGTITAGNGNAGGNSSFGAFMNAGAGNGGTSGSISLGGTAVGGTLNVDGGIGGLSTSQTLASTEIVTVPSKGGDSVLGFGGTGAIGTGFAGSGYGAGGCGAYQAAKSGAAGTSGICIVTEYI